MGNRKAKRVDEEIDGLYALPLGEFVEARNALARKRRAAGDAEGAAAVKALAKPSLAAWAVNRLWLDERKRFEELLNAGEGLRKALQGGGDGRESAAARRRALTGLSAAAEKLLQEEGHAATAATRQRIDRTLEALSASPGGPDAPRPGRLSADLEPPGFEALAGLALPPAGRPTRAARRAGEPSRDRPPSKGKKAGQGKKGRQAGPRKSAAESSGAKPRAGAATAASVGAAAGRTAAGRARERKLTAARKAVEEAEAKVRRQRQAAGRAREAAVVAERRATAAAAEARKRHRATGREADQAGRAAERAEQQLGAARKRLAALT